MQKIKCVGNLPKRIAAQALLNKTVEVLGNEKWTGKGKVNKLLSAAKKLKIEANLTNSEDMRSKNLATRGRDYATDVLSWNLWIDGMWPEQEVVGEVLICFEVAEKQALENGWSLEDEIKFLLVHGFLHVFGMDHELGKKQWLEQFFLHGLIMPQAQPMIEKLKKQTF